MRISGATTEVVVAMVEIVTTYFCFGQLNSGRQRGAPVLGAAAASSMHWMRYAYLYRSKVEVID